MRISDSKLTTFLLDTGLVSRREIVDAEAEAKKRGVALKSVLLARGVVPESDLRKLEAYILGIPFIDLRGQMLDLGVLSVIPEPLSRNLNVIAYKKDGHTLEVAVLDPSVINELAYLEKKHRFKVLLRLTDSESIKHSLLSYQEALKEKFGETIGDALKRLRGDAIDEAVLVSLVDTILSHALLEHASDIHIEPEDHKARIRYRINGRLEEAMVLPREILPLITQRLKFLARVEPQPEGKMQDGRFELDLSGERINIRASFLSSIKGEKIVLRLVREGASGFTLEALGFSQGSLDEIHEVLRDKKGMILVSGGKSSGKTTTLYTMLDILNTPDISISTIENPVEFVLDRVYQTEVARGEASGLAEGLRALVRQDSDVILVGSLEDGETADLAIHTARARKLILTSVEARTSQETIEKILSLGVNPSEFASSLRLIIYQILVRRLDHARSSYFLTRDEQLSLGKLISLDSVLKKLKKEGIVDESATWDDVPFWKGEFTGEEHLLLNEVVNVGARLSDLIERGGTTRELEEALRASSTRSILEDGLIKAVQGHTTLEEVLKKCVVEREPERPRL